MKFQVKVKYQVKLQHSYQVKLVSSLESTINKKEWSNPFQ